MLKKRLNPNDCIVQGTTTKGRPFTITTNANSGLPTLYLFDVVENSLEIRETRLTLREGGVVRVPVITVDNGIATAELPLERSFSHFTECANRIESTIEKALGNTTLAHRPLAKSTPPQIARNRPVVCAMLLVLCAAAATSLRFLPSGALPNDLSLLLLPILPSALLIGFFVKRWAGFERLLFTATAFSVLFASTSLSNALTLSRESWEGQVVEILHTTPWLGDRYVLRIVRKKDSKSISIIATEDWDLSSGDSVSVTEAEGILGMPAYSEVTLESH